MTVAQTPILVFGEDWGGLPSSTQHLFAQIGQTKDVTWFNSIAMRSPRLDSRDLKRALHKLRGENALNPMASLPSHLTVKAPRVLPFHGSPMAQAINRRVLKNHAPENPIIWATLPTAAPYLATLKPRKMVYYACDDYSALPHVDPALLAAMEGQMVAQADLIIATSEPLAAKFPAHKTKILPHGVDTKLFQTPVAAAPDMPLRKPIAGFYGSLANWIDVQMLAETAKALPEWQFVLIGKQETDVSELEKLENVLLLGARPHLALPSYVQHWQVALLPFKDCPQITACNPLKLREYLSSGTPIASTDFPALAPYAPYLAVCKTGESFKNTLLTAAANNSPEQRALRQASVNGESWQQRAAKALQWLEAA